MAEPNLQVPADGNPPTTQSAIIVQPPQLPQPPQNAEGPGETTELRGRSLFGGLCNVSPQFAFVLYTCSSASIAAFLLALFSVLFIIMIRFTTYSFQALRTILSSLPNFYHTLLVTTSLAVCTRNRWCPVYAYISCYALLLVNNI